MGETAAAFASAGFGRMEVDGLLGPMCMPVMTAVFAPIGGASCV